MLVLVMSPVLEGDHQSSPAPLVRFPLLVPVVMILLARLLELLVHRRMVMEAGTSVCANWLLRKLPKR